MVTMRLSQLICVPLLLLGLAATSAQAQSIGRWNLPSTTAQYFGCGYGPGHHAPMVRMPCCAPMKVQRLEFVETPCHSCSPCNCGFAGASSPCWNPGPQPCYGGYAADQNLGGCPCSAPQQLFCPPAMPAILSEPQLGPPQAVEEALPVPDGAQP